MHYVTCGVTVHFDCVTAVKAIVLDGEQIVGLSIMKPFLYVLRQLSSEIEVYCTDAFKLQRRLLVSCSVGQVTSSLSVSHVIVIARICSVAGFFTQGQTSYTF